MNAKNQILYTLLFFLLASAPVIPVAAGHPGDRENVVLIWNAPRIIPGGEGSSHAVLTFRGSVLTGEYGMLPLFLKSYPFDAEQDSVSALIVTDQVFEPLAETEALQVADLEKISTDIVVFHRLSVSRKQSSGEVCVIPLRRNPVTRQVEKLLSFTLEVAVVDKKEGTSLKSGQAYASHSVLATGTWFKFATGSNAIHRLTYEELKNSGMNVDGIDPRNLRVYGNGGGVLPEANATPRIDDLMENAIIVYGEEDGQFNPGDYLLYYGQGPDQWYFRTENLFRCRKNVYSDRMFYFITADLGPGKRVGTEFSTPKPATFQATRFEDFISYEKDEVNLIKTGREWWDRNYFDITTQRSYAFNFPDIDPLSPVTVFSYVAARSITGPTTFTISAEGNSLLTLPIDRVSEGFENVYANIKTGQSSFFTANPSFDVTLKYQKHSSSSVGYLNYIEVNASRLLKMHGSQMSFRSASGTAPNAVTEFTLNGNGQVLQIWDVTNRGAIRRIDASQSGTNYIFRLETDTLREFLAFDGGSFPAPEFIGQIENQDLHGVAVHDYLIVSHPLFVSEAERLAAFHRENSGLSVLITTPEKIYNEFSSGAQDITAIRDFVRMMYNRAEPGKEPRYLLLFGDASYDYKERIPNNTNFIPSFESLESLSPVSSFVSDDYFGLLDPNEGQSAGGVLDIGIGRFPVTTPAQAKSAVDKVLHYCSQSVKVKNDWRNVVTFVGDDQNEGGNLFVQDSEDLAQIIEQSHKSYNVDKIYSDAYSMVSTPGGARYPEVNDVINKRVDKGSLIMNYVGHGGEVGWAHERILEVPDIQNWRNYDQMPVFVTATCEFSRYDDPGRVSAGEWVFLNELGGGVALYTTTRLTFAGTNKSLLVNFYNKAFNKISGEYMKLGDLLVAAKKGMGSSPNIHAFVLIGDPAMQMAYPELNVVTTSVNGHVPSSVPDTLKALSEVTITGEIRDLGGEIAVDFSGTIYPTVYDKSSEIWTKANSGEYPPVQFFLRKNPVYKGKVAVTNGSFAFSFIVPKDIAYQFGAGKISYYALSETTDANGYDEGIQVGGYNNLAAPDDLGPEVTLYLNNRMFRSGGVTDQNPILLADVSDDSGINTVGNGIGHDITAVLDGKTTFPMILNDYYVSDLNTFKSGHIGYPLTALSDGPHQVTVKVWDVHNNSSEASLDFIVVSSAQFAFEHLLTFPNPMRDHTTFAWETNQVDQPLNVEIQIYTLNGRPVKKLNQTIPSPGYREASVQWDGTQDNGMMISSGLYVYTVKLSTPDGNAMRQSSKLVVIR